MQILRDLSGLKKEGENVCVLNPARGTSFCNKDDFSSVNFSF